MGISHVLNAFMTYSTHDPYWGTEVILAMSNRRLQTIATPRAVTPPAGFELLAVALLILLIAAAVAP